MPTQEEINEIANFVSNLRHKVKRDTLLLHERSFSNISGLARKLKDSSDELSKFLYSQFSTATQNFLEECISMNESPKKFPKAIVNALNELLESALFYSPSRFANCTLAKRTNRLLKHHLATPLEGQELFNLNRSLLEDFYQNEIKKKLGKETLEDYAYRVLLPELQCQFPQYSVNELLIVGLMAYLGPRQAGGPPLVLYEELAGIAADVNRAAVIELAIAYGCKWHRQYGCNNYRWDDIWSGAKQEITDITYNFVVQMDEVLEDIVRDFEVNEQFTQDDATWIAEMFIENPLPQPDAPVYLRFHTIQTWDPNNASSLYGWLKIAVQGRRRHADEGQNEAPQKNSGLQENDPGNQHPSLATNFFRESLLYKVRTFDKRLDIRDIAVQICQECGNEAEYEGKRNCSDASSGCTGERIVLSKLRIIVPTSYVPWSFFRCNNSVYRDYNTHYDEYWEGERPPCSVCQGTLSQRPTELQIRKAIGELLAAMLASRPVLPFKGKVVKLPKAGN